MSRLPITIPPWVTAQITEQVLYIANDSIDLALFWESRLFDAINRLGEFHGHAIDEEASDRSGHTVRKVVFEGTYLIFYRVDTEGSVVEIVNFRHGARLPRIGEP